LIRVIQHGSPEEAALVRGALVSGGLDDLDRVLMAIRRSGALEYTRQQAEAEVRAAGAALDSIPSTQYRDSLLQLAQFAVTRTH
jgi:octaprenyl-diphosphate synthase